MASVTYIQINLSEIKDSRKNVNEKCMQEKRWLNENAK